MRTLSLFAVSLAASALAGDRAVITLPDGCAFQATDDGATVPVASRCAQMLLNVNKAFITSDFREQCQDWPDLESATLGNQVPGLEFLPMGKGVFLVRFRCFTAAYNEGSLVFVWNEHVPAAADEVPPLLMFPFADGHAEAVVAMRDFDAKKLALWALVKEAGDGSGGVYRRFSFEQTVPMLEDQVSKQAADNRDGYTFSRRAVPKGAAWKREQAMVRGCVSTLGQPRCAGR